MVKQHNIAKTESKCFGNLRAGLLLSVKVILYSGAVQHITGVCLSVRSRGFDSSFVIRRTDGAESHTTQRFPFYSPFLLEVKPLRVQTAKRKGGTRE